MAQSAKGVSLSTYATGPGPGDDSGYREPLAFRTGQAELTFPALGTAGSHILAWFSSQTLRIT